MIKFKLADHENHIGSLAFKIAPKGADVPVYTGETVITPTTETQTLQTANKKVLEDIVVNPIPNNYGLVTWDGSRLMIS